ncbi:MAG: DNA mismatch repair endonuclease MutL [Verrucomicrobia bacterium]|nr:DNA mismatch repair endonuclease MutL [Cytophagales bacterium]
MKDIIQLLPDFLANQIAAGEVVQRPASVVKELMENAIDAGANTIQLLVKEAGKILIQVIDDGNGMSETDARMSFERHATSKIKTTNDLFNIRTMGFRGEALASIAAVAQVEMKSRRQSDELGTCLKIEGSEVKSQENIQSVVGTSISVKNLFFNVPARRNFLKSNAVEMRHIIDEFHRIALSYPEKNFSLVHNDTEIYKLTAGKLSHRVVAMFGKNYREQLAPCHEETAFVSIQGYVGKPEFSKKTRGEQFFFVNNRYIRHNYLHHAVMSAYENLVPEGCFPFYVLFIEINPVHIDINVHPTKTEIKFDDERAVYAIVAAAVRKALGTNNMMPSLDFEMNVNFDDILLPKASKNTKHNNSGDYPQKSNLEKSNTTHWTKLYQDFQDAFLKENADSVQTSENETVEELTFASRINTLGENETLVEEQDYKKIFSLHNRFLMVPVRSGILLIDRQLAHERILYERFMERLKNQVSSSQTLLFPVGIEINPADFTLLEEISAEIHHLGFGWNILGKNTIALHSVPAEINSGTEKNMLEALIEQFKWNQAHLQLETRENVVQALAKRSSVKPGSLFSAFENTALIEQLFVCKNPNYTPDGKPVFVKITLDKLADFFG